MSGRVDTIDAFRTLAEALDGARLKTVAQGREFSIQVSPDGMAFTPRSTRKERVVPWSQVERVIQAYKETASYRKSDYQDFSFDASYILAILHHINTPRVQ